MEEAYLLTLQDIGELQNDHDSKIKELYAEWQKRKQEQEMTHLQQTHIDQHNIRGINDAANTQVENEDAETRRARVIKRLEARLKSIDTGNPYTVAHLAL